MKHSRIIRRREVQQRTGLSASGIYAKIADGRFPKPIKIGPRAAGWVEAEIDDWIEMQIRLSRTGA